jgi:hypothetical protein
MRVGAAWLWLTNGPGGDGDPQWAIAQWDDLLVSSAYADAAAANPTLPPLAGSSFWTTSRAGHLDYQGSQAYRGQTVDPNAGGVPPSTTAVGALLSGLALHIEDLTVERPDGTALRIVASTEDAARFAAAHPFPLSTFPAGMRRRHDGILLDVVDRAGAPSSSRPTSHAHGTPSAGSGQVCTLRAVSSV